MAKTLNILIAPLDWGLGHSSRCVPIIHYLQSKGANVYVAVNDMQQKYFTTEIQNVEYLPINGYNITYGKNKFLLLLHLLLQVPKIIKTMQYEHAWLQKIVGQKKIDVVISDNRYGMYAKGIKSIFITHQTQIQAPFFGAFINAKNKKLIANFTACWLPDFQQEPSLSGNLSHAVPIPNSTFIGAFSRLEKTNCPTIPNTVLLILSGPEPQKSVLLQTAIEQLGNTIYTIKIAGAHVNFLNGITLPTNIHFVQNMDSVQLQNEIAQSQIVISRSGYTTLMDLAKLNKHAILIPTPAQTEQEYIGTICTHHNWHLVVEQHHLDLQKQILQFTATTFSAYPNEWNFNAFQKALDTIF